MRDYGTVTVRREDDRVRITQSDPTALISASLLGHYFAGNAPYLRLIGDRLTIRDDFGAVVTYRLGEYVFVDHMAGFELTRMEQEEVI